MNYPNDNVVRIVFHRCIKDYIHSKSLKFSVSLSSEFSGLVSGLIKDCTLGAYFITPHESIDNIDTHIDYIESAVVKGDVCHIVLRPPEVIGSYKLFIYGRLYPECCVILPLLTDVITIYDECPPPNFNILCTTYRPLNVKIEGKPVSLLVKEDRGITMGSHLWDSCVVFCRHIDNVLSKCVAALGNSRHEGWIAVELGAGCALASILLAKSQLFSHVYCTDLSMQVPLSRENLLLNDLSDTIVSAHELDWKSETSLCRFQSEMGSGYADVIVAADVLYEPAIATNLFHVIRALARPQHTVIFIAQKIRGSDARGSVDVNSIEGFQCAKVISQADVVLWKLTVC